MTAGSPGLPAAEAHEPVTQTIGRPVGSTSARRFAGLLDPDVRRLAVPSALFGVSAASVVTGTLSLSMNSLDFLRLPLMALLVLTTLTLAWLTRRDTGVWERGTLVIVAAAIAGFVFLTFWTPWLYGYEINGVVHRSLFTSVILLGVGLPALCNSLYYVLGATPTAWDTSRYPLLLFPILFALFIYAALLLKVVIEGWPGLGWDIVSTPYNQEIVNGQFVRTPGMRNHLLGTLLLIAMTATIALPIGVGAGVLVSEYPGRLATVVGFCTQLLRAISIFILAVTAFSIVNWSEGYAVGDWRSDWFRGFYYDDDGFKIPAHGSFVTASMILSLLVIPVIAKATEEGFRAIPRDMREASISLGATEGHGLINLLFPWALPSILTGLVLGCAEAAGSVAILLFIAGNGEFGIGPFREVTSLGYLIYAAERSPQNEFKLTMGAYTYTAAVLLLFITFALTVAATYLKQRFGQRYRTGST